LRIAGNIGRTDRSAHIIFCLEHDRNVYPTGRFKDPDSGLGYNMGFCGAYPLFSGICTPEQEKILLEKVFSEKHMWTPAGICVID
jgi:hypothetical protein